MSHSHSLHRERRPRCEYPTPELYPLTPRTEGISSATIALGATNATTMKIDFLCVKKFYEKLRSEERRVGKECLL